MLYSGEIPKYWLPGKGGRDFFLGHSCVLCLAFVETSNIHLRFVHVIGYRFYIKRQDTNGALAEQLSLLELRPAHQKLAGSIPRQGTYLVACLIPGSGVSWGQLTNISLSHGRFSLCLPTPSLLPLKSIKHIL